MILCHCKSVSDRAIRAAIAAGASSVADISLVTGAGKGCGGCVPAIEVLLADAALAFESPERLATAQRLRRTATQPAV